MLFFEMIIAAFASIFTENLVLSKGLGSSTMIMASRSRKQLMGVSVCITYFSTLCSVILYFIGKLKFIKFDTAYAPMIYTLVVGAVYCGTLFVLIFASPKMFARFKNYIHLSAFNCSVLGCLMINTAENETFFDYLNFGFFSGVGFLTSAYMLKIAYNRLNSENVPLSFRGYPAILIYIGILSMAIYGFVANN
ncbi:MAG: hypothetical protein IJO29_00560 [Oscillospiraceae bacterium]|nr:hypothetical protein [Oscillospiraceae bacterium]